MSGKELGWVMLIHKLIQPCREIASRLAGGEFEGAPWRVRLIVRAHLFMCRHCRRFARQLELISEGLRDVWKRVPDPKILDAVQRRILARLTSR